MFVRLFFFYFKWESRSEAWKEFTKSSLKSEKPRKLVHYKLFSEGHYFIRKKRKSLRWKKKWRRRWKNSKNSYNGQFYIPLRIFLRGLRIHDEEDFPLEKNENEKVEGKMKQSRSFWFEKLAIIHYAPRQCYSKFQMKFSIPRILNLNQKLTFD